MKLPAFLEDLRADLLPWESAEGNEAAFRRAAVLVLLYPREGRVTFPLTVRPDSLSRHPGQISLPGGMVEPYDESLWHTALRETQEELGILPDGVQPLGRLSNVPTRIDHNVITPFVAWSPGPPRFIPDRCEVAEVIEVSLDSLLEPEAIEEEVWELRGSKWRVTFYRLDNRVVWGITGQILSDLHNRLQAQHSSVRAGWVRPLS